MHKIGEGVYFTDSLDFAWFYASEDDDNHYDNINKIPKVGQSFTFVASEIYYDRNKFDIVYDTQKRNIEVEKNGIRCGYGNYGAYVLNETQLNTYKGFIGKEFVITDKNQILPLYAVTIKRVEYLVIWRDYNFNSTNPNNYGIELFNEIQEFHREIKKYLARELNTKIYYIENDEEAMKLLDRKKYNKIIIITNGNNNGMDFINNARNIIGSNAMAAVSTYDIMNHILWVKNMENVLILNGIDFHKKFFKCIIREDKNLFRELKEEISEYYKYIAGFNLLENSEELFKFPNFKGEGLFSQLNFERENIKSSIIN